MALIRKGPKDDFVHRVQSSYRELSAAAASLNKSSDSLGASVSNLDAALKKLGLGITSWAEFERGSDDNCAWSSDVGYTKNGGKWGIAIRSTFHDGGEPDITEWPFHEAPRGLRIAAVAKIPELLDQLREDAEKLARRVDEKTSEVTLLTEAILQLDEPSGTTSVGKMMTEISSSAKNNVPMTSVPSARNNG